MAGRRSALFDAGDSAERLAEAMLGSLAFVSPVPRQMDVGYDLFCVLKERDGEFNVATAFFTVQVKLSAKKIVYRTPHEIAWLRHQENPHLVAIVSKRPRPMLSLYSTAIANQGYRGRNAKRIELVMGKAPEGTRAVDTVDTGPPTEPAERQTIYLGPPVLTMTVEDAMHEAATTKRRAVLRFWVRFEREILSRIHARLYFIEDVPAYTTNEVPSCEERRVVFIHNPQNLPGCIQNYAQAAIALRVVARRALGTNDHGHPQLGALVRGVEAALAADPALLGFLREMDAGFADEIAKRAGRP